MLADDVMHDPQPKAAPALRYEASPAALGPSLGPRFLELAQDAAADRWLAEIGARPHGALTSAAVNLLSRFASAYDAHGWLRAYQMHLLSTEQLARLLGGGDGRSLLDVGAGAGYVTEHARALFADVVCTETSAGLRRRLAQRGLDVRAHDLSETDLPRSFDVVACLNVLDRTARPLSLLSALARHVAPGGKLLLSVPLPVNAHVHIAGGTVSSRERLPERAREFEGAARELSTLLSAQTRLGVRSFSRVPYLSRGDRGAPYYVLDAGVWVLSEDAPTA